MIMPPDNVVVRKATPTDRDDILALVLAAFSGVDHDGHEEVRIVTSTWELRSTALDLELAAVMDGVVVGHVLAAWGDLSGRAVAAVGGVTIAPTSGYWYRTHDRASPPRRSGETSAACSSRRPRLLRSL